MAFTERSIVRVREKQLRVSRSLVYVRKYLHACVSNGAAARGIPGRAREDRKVHQQFLSRLFLSRLFRTFVIKDYLNIEPSVFIIIVIF